MMTDNGSAYTAMETIIFTRKINLKSCFSPINSPQSNGMSEALVNTFKRDYVHLKPFPSAEIVLKIIAEWFEDYNENHPHSGLRMRSPREFRSAQTATA
jgi:transposase InsO family protein